MRHAIAAQQKATINYTTVGNTITATVTPDPTAPDVGGMALDVINGGTKVIQNVTNWYAYNAQELFLPTNGGTFTINLGATQDNVTHIASLPMRGDLLSVTGDGLNLSFSMVGTGDVLVDLANIGHAHRHWRHDRQRRRQSTDTLADQCGRKRCFNHPGRSSDDQRHRRRPSDDGSGGHRAIL